MRSKLIYWLEMCIRDRAIRLQALNKTLEWDGANMCFTNIGDNETIRTCLLYTSEVDRKIIVVKDAVKEVGSYKAIVKLHKEVSVEIPFEVVAE